MHTVAALDEEGSRKHFCTTGIIWAGVLQAAGLAASLLHGTSEMTSKIKPQQQYWTLGKCPRVKLDHAVLLSSRATRWWLTVGRILGHRNQIKNGKWNRRSKLSCYLCKRGLHSLLRNEEGGGRRASASVQQQAELGTVCWPCSVNKTCTRARSRGHSSRHVLTEVMLELKIYSNPLFM